MPKRKPESPQERIRRLVARAKQDAAAAALELASVWVDEPFFRDVLRAFAFPQDTQALTVAGVPVRKLEFVSTV